MKRTTISNIKLGFFVLLGLSFLLISLYLIGTNQNLFDQTFEVKATFYNVNGLMKGNNVRFAGIDVGTIKRVEIITDTSVQVTMVIKDEVHPYIKSNSVAAVGTDGLMGNKLVNIVNVRGEFSEIIKEGAMLTTNRPVETDEMLRTLYQTNKNLYTISNDLKQITGKVTNNNALWNLLSDSSVSIEMKKSISSIQTTTRNTAIFTQELNLLLKDIQNGKGTVGILLKDTATSRRLKSSIQQLQDVSKKALQVTTDIKHLTDKIKNGQGVAGTLLSDSTASMDVKQTLHNVQVGTLRFDQNMEALKHNFLFRGYFKRLEKEQKKIKLDSAKRSTSH